MFFLSLLAITLEQKPKMLNLNEFGYTREIVKEDPLKKKEKSRKFIATRGSLVMIEREQPK